MVAPRCAPAGTITVVGCHAGGEVGNVVVGGVSAAAGRDGLRADAGAARRRLAAPAAPARAARQRRRAREPHRPVDARRLRRRATSSWSRPSIRRCRARTRSASRPCCSRPAWSRCTSPRRCCGSRRPPASSRCARRAATGACESVELTNVPCFADQLDAPLEVDGLGTIAVDVAFGGMWYAIADARALGFALEPSEARELCACRRADPRSRRASSCRASIRRTRRSPASASCRSRSRGAASARRRRTPSSSRRAGSTARRPAPGCRRGMAVLHARGQMRAGDAMTHASVIGSTFDGRIVSETTVGGRRRSCRRSAAARGSPASRRSSSTRPIRSPRAICSRTRGRGGTLNDDGERYVGLGGDAWSFSLRPARVRARLSPLADRLRRGAGRSSPEKRSPAASVARDPPAAETSGLREHPPRPDRRGRCRAAPQARRRARHRRLGRLGCPLRIFAPLPCGGVLGLGGRVARSCSFASPGSSSRLPAFRLKELHSNRGRHRPPDPP